MAVNQKYAQIMEILPWDDPGGWMWSVTLEAVGPKPMVQCKRYYYISTSFR